MKLRDIVNRDHVTLTNCEREPIYIPGAIDDTDVPARPGGYHKVSVTDNGIGFSNEYADSIFGLFKRLHTQKEFRGTGIGLAICRKIMVRHPMSLT